MANLSNELEVIATGNDAIVIRRMGGRIIGGRTIDLSDWNESAVKAGHVIIMHSVDEIYKPMPVADGAYASLPEGFEYAGVLVRTITKVDPRGAIQYDGEINDKAIPYPIDGIKEALKAQLPSLYFKHD